MQENEYTAFTFFRSYYEAAQELTDRQRLALYDAIIQYGLEHTLLDIRGVARSLFTLIKPVLDKSSRRMQAGKQLGKAQAELIEKQNAIKNELSLKQSASKREANAEQSASECEANAEQSASECEANAEQSVSKREANAKQSASKREANAKQSVSKTCTDKDKDKDKDQDQETVKGAQSAPDDLAEFSQAIQTTLKDWFSYKSERRQGYKTTGRRNFLLAVRKALMLHGEGPVIKQMHASMANNYAGAGLERIGAQLTGIVPVAAKAAKAPNYDDDCDIFGR